MISLLLAWLGGVVNGVSYGSPAPLFVALALYAATRLLMLLFRLNGRWERSVFNRLFGVGLVASGIAAVYANQFADPQQLFSDPSTFFTMATFSGRDIALQELRYLNEGSLAIRTWALIYDGFDSLGIDKAPFTGIFVNVCAVALSGVVGVRMVKSLVGEDDARLRRFMILTSTCGLFWLFSAIHLRDAFVLLATTTLVAQWVWFVKVPWSVARLVVVAALSAFSSSIFAVLRNEYVYLPVLVSVAAGVAIVTTRASEGRSSRLALLAIGGMVAVGAILLTPVGAIVDAVVAGRGGYEQVVFQEAATGSLADRLILNMPLPVRAILGSAYLLVFPIPFWAGYDQVSAYHLFKSFNAIGFYFIAPLLALAVKLSVTSRQQRTPVGVFLTLLSVGFTLMIAVTSLETRHLGGFLVPMFVLCTLPDLRAPATRRQYVRAVTAVLLGMGAIHGAWLIIKT